MSSLMISVAGIRGIIGDSLVADEFVRFTAAFTSTLENRTIVLGSDTRPSRVMLRHLVTGACMATGCRVLDLGVCPTPTVGFMTRHLGAGGGIAITASHNPLQWNALKFFGPEGIFLLSDAFHRVIERYREGEFDYVPHDRLGSLTVVENPTAPHLAKVLGAVDVGKIRDAGFTVAVDLCNGAGIALMPALLKELGCRMIPLFDNPDRAFERTAEPLPENLGPLGELVRSSGADIGLAMDPDADRLAIVDETGKPIGEERTLTLVSRAILQDHADLRALPLVANLSTTRALDDVAAEFGTRVERTRIGEANVVEKMMETGAAIGGEGNGGVIYPTVHPGRDAATGIAWILAALAEAKVPISELNHRVPDYAMAKQKVSVKGRNIASIIERLRDSLARDAETVSDIDGLKIGWADSWVHVRPSGTEPIVRVFAEAPTTQAAEALAARAMAVVRQ